MPQLANLIQSAADWLFVPAGVGTKITFTTNFGTFKSTGTQTADCLTILVTGKCKVILLSNSVGTSTINASVTILGLTRSTNGTAGPGGSGPQARRRVAANLLPLLPGTNRRPALRRARRARRLARAHRY